MDNPLFHQKTWGKSAFLCSGECKKMIRRGLVFRVEQDVNKLQCYSADVAGEDLAVHIRKSLAGKLRQLRSEVKIEQSGQL